MTNLEHGRPVCSDALIAVARILQLADYMVKAADSYSHDPWSEPPPRFCPSTCEGELVELSLECNVGVNILFNRSVSFMELRFQHA